VIPPGRLVDLGTHRLHLRSAGEGLPPVVLEAALGASSLSWVRVQPAVARATRAISYDRAGFGSSDAGPLPRTVGQVATELRAMLQRAAVAPPYVLVGHSFGGFVVRLYASRHPAEVGGLVLVDPAYPEDWIQPSEASRALIDKGARLCRYGAVAARFGLARIVAALATVGALPLARAIARLSSRGALSRDDEAVLAPAGKLPPEVRRTAQRAWTRPKFFVALGSHIESICESARQVADATGPGYGDLPLVTISPSNADPRRLERQASLARLSTRGRHVVAATPGHWIPLDDPETVTRAIVDVVETVRSE
jgi:pimeloyl-ACP methyl ester carboxylesterase